jgi:hypothetical protein
MAIRIPLLRSWGVERMLVANDEGEDGELLLGGLLSKNLPLAPPDKNRDRLSKGGK